MDNMGWRTFPARLGPPLLMLWPGGGPPFEHAPSVAAAFVRQVVSDRKRVGNGAVRRDMAGGVGEAPLDRSRDSCWEKRRPRAI